MRSVRLRIAAKTVLFLGLASCLLGTGIYCVLCMPEVMNIPMNLTYLWIVGCVAVIFALVSAILHACATAAERSQNALATEEEKEDAIARLANQPQEPVCPIPLGQEEVAIPNEADAEPNSDADPKDEDSASADRNKWIKIAAIAAIPATIACTVAIASAKAKRKKRKKLEQERREKEANRQAFYRWLG